MADPEGQAPWLGRRSETFYNTIRPLAVLSKFLGTFPLGNTLKKDGRNVTFSYFALIQLWGLLLCFVNIIAFMYACSELVDSAEPDANNLTLWVTFICYVTIFHTIVQFLLVHFYSAKIPALLQNLEDYHQGIGSTIVKNYRGRWLTWFLPIVTLLINLFVLELAAYYYFYQFKGNTQGVMPIAISYMYANIWRELPMNIFLLFVKYLIDRFYEIRDGIRKLKKEPKVKELEKLRLQHAALARVKEHLEDCYGLQIAVNVLFLLLDIVLQWFIFFVIASSSNYILMLLSFYLFCMCVILVAWVEHLKNVDKKLSQEIMETELHSTSVELRSQVQLFATQILIHPATISASGFFNINNSLLCALMGAVATYIVLLVQFTPYFEMYLANITLPSFDFSH